MKTVFILGAGASRDAGAPLMADFLDRAEDLYTTKAAGTEHVRADFERVFAAIAELQGIHAKSYLDLYNIEDVFGAVEMASTLGKLGNRSANAIREIRQSLVKVIYTTLECCVHFPLGAQGDLRPHESYKRFLEFMTNAAAKAGHQFAYITFNYDLCLDFAMHHRRIRYDYCLEKTPKSDATPLLKLHGSINWGQSGARIVPEPFGSRVGIPGQKYAILPMGTELNRRSNSDRKSGGPVIVPPTWSKSRYRTQLANVWAAAAQQLSEAQNIFVIGYSLPETDSFFRYLFSLGSQGGARLRRFVVVNPDEGERVERRFRDMVGRGVLERFQMIYAPFVASLETIHKILLNP